MDTFSGKKSKTGNDDIQPQRIIWAALIFTTIALISFAFSLTLPGMNQTWQVYLIISLTALALVMDVIGTALILRGKYTQGLKLLYWSLLLTVPPNALLVTNTTFILIAIVLIAGLVQVYYLQPREWRKFYQFGPIIASFFMMGFEIANPPFRLELVKSSTTSGNYGLLILSFLILSLLILAARLAWTGGLRNKLLVVLTGVIILLVTGTSIIDYINSQQEVKEDELQTMNFLYADYLSDVEALEESASALSVTLATRNDIKQLFLERDREGLIDLLTPMFETLRDEYDIRHLYIENLNGTVFVRIHNPANFGDDITYRPTAADALSTRRTVAGVDIGPNRIGVRSVSPMFVNGNFMGLLEVGLDYDQTYIDSVKAHTGADYTMWVSNAAAAPAGLKPAEGVIEPPISELFFYSSTSQNQFNIDKSVYQRVLQTGSSELQYVAIESGEFVVLVAPLLGYGDRIIGVLEISVSRADTLATLQSDLNSEILTGLAFFLLGLVLMWYTSQFILLRPLGNLTSVAQRQLEGDLTARAVITTKDELGQLGQTLNTVTAKLQETLQDLEGRVAARTKDLAIVAEVGTATSSILETDRLLQEVVDLTKERFSLYHSHIYMLDDAGENLVLAKGAGEPGRIMAAEKRSIPMNSEQSLVARAARERKGVTINDVTLAPDFLPNPLLPNTRSEMAVPMLVGETLIGVFDIQSDVADRFTDSDINIQTTLASQLATSVQNARSFERSKAQADFESTLNAISQKIQRAGTIEDTLQTAIRELGTAIGASRVKANISGQKRGNNN